MNEYSIIFTQKPGETGVVVTAKAPWGEGYAVAHGQTLDEALKSLRPFAMGTLVEAANNGEDPLAILVLEEPKHPEAVLSEKDLFPIVLRYLRARQGLTQAEMAERLGIAQPSYAEYEKAGANPTLDTLLRLNKVLGHKIIAMLAGTPQVA